MAADHAREFFCKMMSSRSSNISDDLNFLIQAACVVNEENIASPIDPSPDESKTKKYA